MTTKRKLFLAFAVFWLGLGYLQLHWSLVGWPGEPAHSLVLVHRPVIPVNIPSMEESTYREWLNAGLFPDWYTKNEYTVIANLSAEFSDPLVYHVLVATRVVFLLGLLAVAAAAIWTSIRAVWRRVFRADGRSVTNKNTNR